MRNDITEDPTNLRGRKFMHDMGVYALSNIGSKLITFLLVPFYTYFITDTAEFGYYDIALTAVFFLGPFISLQLTEGSFRFLIDSRSRATKREIITFCARTVLSTSTILVAAALVLGHFADIKYLYFIVAFGIAQSLYDLMLQIVRGLGLQKLFVSATIANALVLSTLSVLALAVLDLGIPGIFMANISARFAVSLFMIFKARLPRLYLQRKAPSRRIETELIRYCLPLLPAVILWWVLNSNNLLFIKHFLGLSENGIYAVIVKFSTILYILSNIFYQTWQQNAIESYGSPDRDRFFSDVFNHYVYLLCGLVVLFPFALRTNYFWLVSSEYQSSAQYLYANAIFIMGFALSSFFELGYQCSKRTKRMIPSVVIAVAANLAGNYLLIPLMGLYGAIVSNIATYVVMIVYRAIDTRKYMRITFDRRNYLALALMASGGVLYYVSPNLLTDVACLAALLALYLYMMPPAMKSLVMKKLRPASAR